MTTAGPADAPRIGRHLPGYAAFGTTPPQHCPGGVCAAS